MTAGSNGEFKPADYDAYRNTCIGFVFQDFNLLPEFDVKKNISLASELQGIDLTDSQTEEILGRVGLEGYGNRKPAELSGGEKQRVAIARALIKNPDVILADEPTGALDSETGKQVLDLLKELSKDKLVIVVSHDREFAEKYADRIIELKDGGVIRDTAPLPAAKETKAPRVFKPSRLSFKNALRMGLSGLKIKPVKLSFAIILSVIAFVMFGFSATVASYNKVNATVQSFSESKVRDTFVRKETVKEAGDLTLWDKLLAATYESTELVPMKKSDLDALGEKSSAAQAGVIGMRITSLVRNLDTDINQIILRQSEGEISNDVETNTDGLVVIDDASAAAIGLIKEAGRLPTAPNEIAVSHNLFELFKIGGYRNGSEAVKINLPEDMVGKTLCVGTSPYEYETMTVAGVISVPSGSNAANKLFVGPAYPLAAKSENIVTYLQTFEIFIGGN